MKKFLTLTVIGTLFILSQFLTAYKLAIPVEGNYDTYGPNLKVQCTTTVTNVPYQVLYPAPALTAIPNNLVYGSFPATIYSGNYGISPNSPGDASVEPVSVIALTPSANVDGKTHVIVKRSTYPKVHKDRYKNLLLFEVVITATPTSTPTNTQTCAPSWTPACNNQLSKTPTLTNSPTSTTTTLPTSTPTGTPTLIPTCTCVASWTPSCWNQ